ncbi:Ubiquitin-like protein 3 [Lunasporangiospora selenospora]|uniref:Ubiquitin-like protein 3 n=1 Tax=Lunasporangiospora selenospora TaxID=979761 RepID=A0A9P6FQ59_9FUNG|nr:Ubiquitin-like protein 3 [Lunasporangiospora selenospora]
MTTSNGAHGGSAAQTDSDLVSLTLLIVSGSRTTFNFRGLDTIEAVKTKVYENWPKDWQEERPASPQSLRILYLGKFLADGSTLESNKIQPGTTTIVHLAITSPEQETHGNSKSDSAAKCKFCLIL